MVANFLQLLRNEQNQAFQALGTNKNTNKSYKKNQKLSYLSYWL